MKRIFHFFTSPHRAKSNYVASADLMRVCAVLLIAWYHIWQQSWLNPVLKIGSFRMDFNPVVRTGYMMVDILLMLSGFLLFLPYARSRMTGSPLPRLGEYYKKRAVRILPSYLFCIFVILFLFALPKGEYASSAHLWTDLLSHLTFTHNLFPAAYHSTRLNGVLWTLAVEVQFYLIAPLFGRAFVKRPYLTWLVMVTAAFAYRIFYVMPMSDYSLHLNRLPAMLDVYANGMMGSLAYVALCKKMRKSGWKSLIFSAAAVLCVVLIWKIMGAQSRTSGDYSNIHLGQMNRRFPLSLLGAAFLVCAGHSLNWLAELISSRPVRWLSMISYNIYIWHAYAALRLKEWRIPPYTAAQPNQAGEQPWQSLYTWLCMAAAIALGALATYLIEKPAARLLTRKKTRH